MFCAQAEEEIITRKIGKFLDKNVWLISMKPGTHTMDIIREGYKSYSKVFDITHGDRLTFDVQLELKEVTAKNDQ